MLPKDKNGHPIELRDTIQYKSSRYGIMRAEVVKLSVGSRYNWITRKYDDIVVLGVRTQINEAYRLGHRRVYGDIYYTIITNHEKCEVIKKG